MSSSTGGFEIIFNSESIQTDSRQIGKIDWRNPRHLLRRSAVARANKSITSSEQYQERRIPVRGKIVGTSVADLASELDSFLDLMQGEATLDIETDLAGTYRRFTARPTEVNVVEGDSLYARNIDFDFMCDDPWGRDTSQTTLLATTSEATATHSLTGLTIGGTNPAEQKLIITVELTTTPTAGVLGTIEVEDPTAGKKCSVTRYWSLNDVVVFDAEENTVQVNGVDVEYVGRPLIYKPGTGLALTMTKTSISATSEMGIVYTKRYK